MYLNANVNVKDKDPKMDMVNNTRISVKLENKKKIVQDNMPLHIMPIT